MIVYRLSKAKHAKSLEGKGAEIAGGRWNSKGTALVYTSESRALCMAEIAVRTPLGNIPTDYKVITIEFPDDAVLSLSKLKLPIDWNSFPHPNSTQKIGDEFVSMKKALVLKVPSSVVQDEFNYLVNSRHKDIEKVKVRKIEDFRFDGRMFR